MYSSWLILLLIICCRIMYISLKENTFYSILFYSMPAQWGLSTRDKPWRRDSRPQRRPRGCRLDLHQWGRRLEGWPSTADHLPGWRRVTRQVWFCTWWTGRTACTVPVALIGAAQPLADGISSCCYVRHELHHGRKLGMAWYSSRPMPSLWSAHSSRGYHSRCVWCRQSSTLRHLQPQSTYFTVRGQSYFSRLQKNIDPPSPSPPGESVLQQRRRVHTRRAERGMGVNILEDERNRIALLQ